MSHFIIANTINTTKSVPITIPDNILIHSSVSCLEFTRYFPNNAIRKTENRENTPINENATNFKLRVCVSMYIDNIDIHG